MAKEAELDNWKNFKVYEAVDDVGQEALNTNWVLVKKDDGVKARLCVRGGQEKNKDEIRTDSPTVNEVNSSTLLQQLSHGPFLRQISKQLSCKGQICNEKSMCVHPKNGMYLALYGR